MEEMLYTIEICKTKDKDKNTYLGKIHSKVGGTSEFKNHSIETLLRDLIYDMQLSFDSFLNSQYNT